MELEAVETRSDSVAVLSFEASGCKPRTQKHPSMTFLGGMMLHGQVSMISGQFLAKAISMISLPSSRYRRVGLHAPFQHLLLHLLLGLVLVIQPQQEQQQNVC